MLDTIRGVTKEMGPHPRNKRLHARPPRWPLVLVGVGLVAGFSCALWLDHAFATFDFAGYEPPNRFFTSEAPLLAALGACLGAVPGFFCAWVVRMSQRMPAADLYDDKPRS